ncbi:MAG: response regulator, partial [Sedimentisphaerales bacterium]|nr:response regulator [Sedimentisphaerales bacterium]
MAGENILLVDTEKNVIISYKTVLEDAGYNVFVAQSEEEALAKLHDVQCDIIITELYLKGKDTISMIKEIKQQIPAATIIVVTAATMNIDIYEHIMNAGADNYFTKPFSPKNLLVNIKKGLGKKSLFEKNRTLENRLKKFERFVTSQHYYCSEDGDLSNNLFFNALLHREVSRAKRYNREFSVILLKINLFGDEHATDAQGNGSELSDELLKHIVDSTRKTDIIFNINGHYAIILVETPKGGSRIVTQRLIQEIANIPVIKNNLPDQIENKLTIDH